MVIQGIIRPPPEIRAVADRTASYVAKNGRAFETRILNSPKGQTPKFAFLHESSPFHSYYQERVRFYENGGVDEKENEQKGAEDAAKKEEATKQLEAVAAVEAANLKTTRKAASAMDPIGKALLTQRTKIADLRRQTEDPPASGASDAADVDDEEANSIQPGTAAAIAVIPPPPPFQFLHIAAPATVTFIQLETIQLTAQFVALSKGTTNFLHEVTAREWNNPAFGFCQPRHGHFAYFSALVDAYSRILQNHGYATDDPLTLAEKQHQRQREEELRNMANNVPHCLDAVAYRVEYQRDQADRARGNDQNDQQPLVSPIDWHDFVVVETIDFAVDEIVTMLPPPPPPSASLYPEVTLSKPQAEDGMDESSDDDEEEDETIRVVPSYTPKVYATNSTNQMETVIDPISGKRVAIKDMPEHMRIQLLDPKWAEERKKFQDKQKESNLVSGDMVARNLERFAQARGDRFGKKVSVNIQDSRISLSLTACYHACY